MSFLFTKLMKKDKVPPKKPYVPRYDSFGVSLPDDQGTLEFAFLTYPDDWKQLRPVLVTESYTQYTVKVCPCRLDRVMER
jgi:hypothetical protein